MSGPLHVAEDAAQWFHRLRHGTDQTGYITQTVLHRFGTDPDIEQALGVLGVILVAVVLAALVTPRPRSSASTSCSPSRCWFSGA